MRRFLMMVLMATAVLKGRTQNYDQWPIPVAPLCEMTCSPEHTYFCLWSPKAREVRVNVYREGEGENREEVIRLSPRAQGTFSMVVNRDLRGKFYTFSVTDSLGNVLPESPGIFAKAVGVNGQRAQVLDMRSTDPEGWQQDKRPAFRDASDAIIYEMHHRDFSIHPSSGVTAKGMFLALTEEGTTNESGASTGIDHLKQLGVTHVHLLPSYDYGSVDETHLDEAQYNWGYDPVNYNVPDGSYSSDAYQPATRIREFKQMVQSLHRAGIRVVMDVVYNHVFDLASSNFERTVPGYFFRSNAEGMPANGSGCGNETASERPMMRKFMVESVLYWVREYHVDGFRFDLMGIHDLETMNAIREALDAVDPSLLMYGEGWAAAIPALPQDQLAMKTNMSLLPGVAAFGDELRDGLRGPWNDDTQGAFLVGKTGCEESIKFGLAGAVAHPDVDMTEVNYSREAWATNPQQMISYVSCHDDMCLADRIQATAPDADEQERMRLQKLAYAAVLTGRGIPFIWCGDEIMRDRKGVHNCYNSPDSINAIDWTLRNRYREVFDAVCQLIALRKQYRWQEDSIRFLRSNTSNVIAYVYDNDILVVLNSNRKSVNQLLPDGHWRVLYATDGNATPKKGKAKIPPQSAVILKKE